MFDLECKQCLTEFSGQRFLLGQEKIPRDLHRDGAGTLAYAAGSEIGICRAQYSSVVHSAMLVEPIVLGSQDRLLEALWRRTDSDHLAAFFAKLSDQGAFGAVNP